MDAVDVHSHFFPQAFLRLVRAQGGPHGASLSRRDGLEWLAMPGHPPVPLTPSFVSAEARLADLQELQVAAQAISLSPPMVYWAPADLGVRLAQAFNDGIIDLQHAFPDRFVGLATLPLQDVAAAVEETERTVALGMRGIYVATTVGERYLDEPEFGPLWELAAARRIPVFIHPQTHLGAEVLGRWHMFNSVGFPMETAVLAARLIFAGTFDRYPALRIVLAHGGGALPILLGRLDHAYRQRRECQEAIPAPPTAYVKHFYFDTLTHDDRALQFLVDLLGPEQIVLGSDAPYDMADPDPVARVRRLGLSSSAAAAVLGRTARALLQWGVKPVLKEG